MNQGLAKVGTNRCSGATIVLQKVSKVQKALEFSMLTSLSFQSIIGATQKRRERPDSVIAAACDGIAGIAVT